MSGREYRTARSTVLTSSSSSANSAAPSLNGSAGATLTSVSHVTSARSTGTMYRRRLKAIYPNVVDQRHAHSKSNTLEMERNMLSAVPFAEMRLRIREISE